MCGAWATAILFDVEPTPMFEPFARFWKRTMAKKKRSKKEISDRARREAENSPIVRQLRELYARGMAELRERRQAEQLIARPGSLPPASGAP